MTTGSLSNMAAHAVVALARHPVVIYAGWVAAGVAMGQCCIVRAHSTDPLVGRSAPHRAAGYLRHGPVPVGLP